MAPTMSQHYNGDREAMRARLVESRQMARPSNSTLTRMMPGCRDETFRRVMELAFEGPRSFRTKTICDIASEIPWDPTKERSSHDGVIGKVFFGVGIIAGLGLACYAFRKGYQVRQIAGEKRKREEDDEVDIGMPKAAEDESNSGNKQRTSKWGQTPALSPRDIPLPAPTQQAIITKPLTPHTPPPFPSASTYPLLNLNIPSPLQDIVALATADRENAEDGAGSEATDSAHESDAGDGDNDDEEEMREEADDDVDSGSSSDSESEEPPPVPLTEQKGKAVFSLCANALWHHPAS